MESLSCSSPLLLLQEVSSAPVAAFPHEGGDQSNTVRGSLHLSYFLTLIQTLLNMYFLFLKKWAENICISGDII